LLARLQAAGPRHRRRRSGTWPNLRAWQQHEAEGSWWAWVTWPRQRNGKYYRHVATVRAEVVKPLESAEIYASVPRRVLGLDAAIRP